MLAAQVAALCGGPQIHAFICVLPPLPCPQPDNMAKAPTSTKSQVIAQLASITGREAGAVLAFVEDMPDDRFTRTFQDPEQALGYWAQKAGGLCLGCEGMGFGKVRAQQARG